MEYEITLSEEIDFAPSSVVKEVLQNCRTILNTVVGSVPLERNIGLSWDYVGKPLPVAMALLKVAVTEAFEQQEPRAQIESISFDVETDSEIYAEQGVLRPHVKIYISEEGA